MRKYCVLMIFLLAASSVPAAIGDRDERFGIGFMLGEPTGMTAKFWLSNTRALDFGLGWSFTGERIQDYYDNTYIIGISRLHFHMDYLWHEVETRRLAYYWGVGGRINSFSGYYTTVALRGPFGVSWIRHRAPFELFAEIVPTFNFVPFAGLGLDGGVGFRFYF